MTDDEAQVLAIIQMAQRDLNKILRNGRYSPGLLFELTQQALDGLNVGSIIDEIKHLEDSAFKSRTRKARQFKGNILKGLWYKHYFQVQFLSQNLIAELSEYRIKELLKPYSQHSDGEYVIMSEDLINAIAQDIVHGGFDRKSARRDVTGEYIVFEKSTSGNHYLTLGRHREDEAIAERVQKSRKFDAEVKGVRLTGFYIQHQSDETT